MIRQTSGEPWLAADIPFVMRTWHSLMSSLTFGRYCPSWACDVAGDSGQCRPGGMAVFAGEGHPRHFTALIR